MESTYPVPERRGISKSNHVPAIAIAVAGAVAAACAEKDDSDQPPLPRKNYRDEAQERAFVLRGTPLCRIGNTGTSSRGTHLHFDRIQHPGTPSAYVSQGVERYIATKTGDAEPPLDFIQASRVAFWPICYAIYFVWHHFARENIGMSAAGAR
ncbi:hypothetical protein HZA42_01870 [Candidatus Peregrinibacteria bacterium]|nr:hypothetical protein [Candidatus Peregrinibacteria bacterium]